MTMMLDVPDDSDLDDLPLRWLAGGWRSANRSTATLLPGAVIRTRGLRFQGRRLREKAEVDAKAREKREEQEQ